MLPEGSRVRVRRVFCLTCGATHAVMPAALLGRIRYTAQTLAPYLESANPTQTWQQNQSNGPKDITTLYRWLRRLRARLGALLPALKQTLLELVPERTLEPYRDPVLSFTTPQLALWLANQILQASGALLEQTPHLAPLTFLNYFCWQRSGEALLWPPAPSDGAPP